MTVYDDNEHWFDYGDSPVVPLDELDSDPDAQGSTLRPRVHLLHLPAGAGRGEAGVLVVNKPASLRDCNEKLFTRVFPGMLRGYGGES